MYEVVAVEDVAPGLLEKIRETFNRNIKSSKKIQSIYKLIQEGTATYAEAEEYAYLVGDALSQAFGNHLTAAALPDGKMYFNIADRVIRPMLHEDHDLVADAAATVQQALNQQAGIGLKAQTVAVNEDQIDGIINTVSAADNFGDVAWMLGDPVKLFSQMVVDATLKENVRFQGKAGLRPKIIRKAEWKCCEWCRSLAGEYDYPDVPDDIYRRHENCRCIVEYDAGSGKRQNVHTKLWTSPEETAMIDLENEAGDNTVVSDLIKAPVKFATYTPESLKEALENDGYEVKPLGQGSLKGIAFENGGGYRVNFKDGGLLQYHPSNRSHHEGAYYKISTGKGGTKRYELDGTEKQVNKSKE